MKPYTLNYSETIQLKKTPIQSLDSTVITEHGGESHDDDGVFASSTAQTFTIEPSDEDEFRTYESTWITRAIEPSDNDEINFMNDSTVMTKSIESSDEDEIYFEFVIRVVFDKT